MKKMISRVLLMYVDISIDSWSLSTKIAESRKLIMSLTFIESKDYSILHRNDV